MERFSRLVRRLERASARARALTRVSRSFSVQTCVPPFHSRTPATFPLLSFASGRRFIETTPDIGTTPQPALDKCAGCGHAFQTRDPNALGYFVPREKRKKKTPKGGGYVSANDPARYGVEAPSVEEVLEQQRRQQAQLDEARERRARERLERQQKLAAQRGEQPPQEEEDDAADLDLGLDDLFGAATEKLPPRTKRQSRAPAAYGRDFGASGDEARDLLERPPRIDDVSSDQAPKTPQPPARVEQDLCQRCFHLRHYGHIVPVRVPVGQFREKLEVVADQYAVVVKIVDIFDFEGSFVPGFNTIVGRNPVILVGNKFDLLPEGVMQQRVVHWLIREAKRHGLQRIIGVHLVSSTRGEGVHELMQTIRKERRGRDVFVMGCSNVGKSTLLNRIIAELNLSRSLRAATSSVPGTTLGIVQVPLSDGSFINDTPGVYNEHQLVLHLTQKELELVLPEKKIQPVHYMVKAGNSFLIGGLARLDYLEGDHRIFLTFFNSPKLKIHATTPDKASPVYEKHLGVLFRPPFLPEQRSGLPPFPVLRPATFKLEGQGLSAACADVVFPGLGWVSVTAPKDCSITLCAWAPASSPPTLREDPLMPFEAPSASGKRVPQLFKR